MIPTNRGIVFHCGAGGLANRLRALVGYQAIGALLKVPFYLIWKANSSCHASFSSLFVAPPPTEISQERDIPDPITIYTEEIWFDSIWVKHGQAIATQADFLRTVRHCIDSLRPRPAIEDAVNMFAALHGLDRRVGIHIRHTDNLDSYDYWSKNRRDLFIPENISSVDGFLHSMDEHAERGGLFLATDDIDIQRRMSRRYGKKLCAYPKEWSHAGKSLPGRATPALDALTDLLLLGKCRTIVGTYYSSFSTLSALLSGTEYYEVQGQRVVPHEAVATLQAGLGFKNAQTEHIGDGSPATVAL